MNNKHAILWDLTGTLLKPSPEGLNEKQVEDYSFVFYMWAGKKQPSRLDDFAFDFLKGLGEQQGNEADIVRNHTGDAIPEIVCQYVGGLITSQKALEKVENNFIRWIESRAQYSLYETQINQVYRMVKAFFDPLVLSYVMKPIPHAVALAEKTKAVSNNTLYILSNWDKESFRYVYDKFQSTLFTLFDKENILISGDTGHLKPQKQIYSLFLNNYSLDPAFCFFIDDQKENIEAAATLGIEGMVIKNDNVELIENTLRSKRLIM